MLNFNIKRVLSRKQHLLKAISVTLLGQLAVAAPAAADTFNVSDETSFIAALSNASTNGQDDIIDLGGNSITLTSTAALSDLDNNELRIQNGTVNGTPGSNNRLFAFNDPTRDSTKVVFDSVTLQGGNYSTGATANTNDGGGAIYTSKVDIEIVDSIIQNNSSSTGEGGAIVVRQASLTVNNSSFINNSSTSDGGAIALRRAILGSISNTLFENNSARRGGAISANAVTLPLTISNSSFIGNQASSQAGAIWSRDRTDVNLSTFYNNTASSGGAIYLQPFGVNDPTTINRSTFVNNASSTGETIYFQGSILVPDFQNSIVIGSNSPTAVNCVDTSAVVDYFPTGSNNITDDTSCGFATVIANGADLFTSGVPADNGGSTPTIALRPQSIAIDAGAPQGATTCTILTDQRGEPVSSNCEVGSFEFQPLAGDGDNDGITDDVDNCPVTSNPSQDDFDGDSIGDACDDSDGDLVFDDVDNCPTVPNANQADSDFDNVGNACDFDSDNDGVDDVNDNCPAVANPGQENSDDDANGNACDQDDDNDGQLDNDEIQCGSDPTDATSLSSDVNANGIPDCVEDEEPPVDTDEDGVADDADNCPAIANPGQENFDNDSQGDLCDPDDDNDNVNDDVDAFPFDASESSDSDEDGIGDNADLDDDNDLQSDVNELLCGSDPLDSASLSPDADNDNIPDCNDPDFVEDSDGDTIADNLDNCPAVANMDQANNDNDAQGDACDPDDDNDNVLDSNDAFPFNGSESADNDEDGIGDNADLDDDNDLQSDLNEIACASDPFDAASMAADADGDNIPNCVDPDFIVDSDGDGIADNVDNCPAIANPGQVDTNSNGIGDACDTITEPSGIKPTIADIATDIEALVGSANSGLTKYYLDYAVRQLNTAVTDSYWNNDNTVTDSNGRNVFYRVGLAVYKLELVADSPFTNASLKASLDQATSTLVDSMRLIATNEIDAATDADGNSWRINYAQTNIRIGDSYRNSDYLSGAVNSYGRAWYYANRAY